MTTPTLSPDSVFTERILRAFPGPRVFWVLLWGSMALLLGLVASSVLPAGSEGEILATEPVGVLINAYVIILSLAAHRLVARSISLRPLIDKVTGGGVDQGRLLRGVNSSIGPLVLAAAITAVEAPSLFDVISPAESLITAPIFLIVHIPLAAGTWIVFTVLVSIDRLGRNRLALDHHAAGPTLGLRPVGELAVRTFAFFALGALPLLVANTESALALGITATIFLVAVMMFFLSMYRIHLQMRAARESAIAEAEEWWASAHRIDDAVSTEGVERRAAMVTVADVLEHRARGIKTWPLTGGMYGQLSGIIIGVLAGLVTRAIAVSVGF